MPHGLDGSELQRESQRHVSVKWACCFLLSALPCCHVSLIFSLFLLFRDALTSSEKGPEHDNNERIVWNINGILGMIELCAFWSLTPLLLLFSSSSPTGFSLAAFFRVFFFPSSQTFSYFSDWRRWQHKKTVMGYCRWAENSQGHLEPRFWSCVGFFLENWSDRKVRKNFVKSGFLGFFNNWF